MLLRRDQYPEYVYIFVDQSILMAVHNLHLTGQYTSALFATFATNPDETLLYEFQRGNPNMLRLIREQRCAISPYFITSMNHPQPHQDADDDAENYRYSIAPFSPSRFSAIFAFDNMEMCRFVSDKHKWDISTVQRFKIDTSHEAEPFTRVARVNMDIVSCARETYTAVPLSAPQKAAIWHEYWKGHLGNNIFPNAAPIWEYLIEGRVLAV